MTTAKTKQKVSYEEELYSPQWKKLRETILYRDGEACRSCGSNHHLQVHHRQYHRDKRTGEWKKPWEYHPVFLVTLCDRCHYEGHSLFAIPIKDVEP
jgi:5-methylcytosine-specific restriction endonuclease McrA